MGPGVVWLPAAAPFEGDGEAGWACASRAPGEARTDQAAAAATRAAKARRDKQKGCFPVLIRPNMNYLG